MAAYQPGPAQAEGVFSTSADGVQIVVDDLGPEEQEKFRSFADKVKNVKDQSPEKMLQMLQEEVGQHVDEEEWMGQAEVRIGIVGSSGSGKSTFINSFRGLGPKDPNAAPVGTTETTDNTAKYRHPVQKKIILMDFPGALFAPDGGSVAFDTKEYTTRFGGKMEECRVLLVFTSGRVHDNAVWIARKAKEMGKKVLFVRSKFDLDVQNMKRDDPEYFKEGEEQGEARLLEKERKDYVSKLETMGFGRAGIGDVFIISGILDNMQRGRWDAPALKEAILKQLDIQQKMLLITTCQDYSPTMARAKAKIYRSRAWKVAFGVAACGVIPYAGTVVNAGTMVSTVLLFKKGFGLNQASVSKLADLTGKSEVDLQRFVDDKLFVVNKIVQFFQGKIDRQSLKATLSGSVALSLSASTLVTALVMDAAIDTAVPFFGGLLTAPASFGLTWYALATAIELQENCALELYKLAFR